MLTIVGLGPGDPGQITLEAAKILKKQEVYLRTTEHPIIEEFKKAGIAFKSFDNFYESSDNFEEVYENIAHELIRLSQNSDIIYAVPGNPVFYEESVRKILQSDIEVCLIPGMSFLDVVATALKEDCPENFLVLDANTLINEDFIPEFNYPAFVTQVYNQFILSEIKLKLMEFLPDEFKIAIISYAGLPEQKVQWIELYKLDRFETDHLYSLYIPETYDYFTSFAGLVETIRKLRAPDGCPWDRKQTHQSLKRYILEEAAEVVEAIEREDTNNLKEELGDVLLEVLLHSQIATEKGEFNIYNVINTINEKMIRRHPHVFGQKQKIENPSEVNETWEEIKRKEKNLQNISEDMRNLPLSLSALLKADKIQHKARSIGFDWNDPKEALNKVLEERLEVIEALEKNDRENLQMEIGDLLFAVVNVARLCGIDSEEALRQSNKKFVDRFEFMENIAQEQGHSLEDYDLDELETLWSKAKNESKED